MKVLGISVGVLGFVIVIVVALPFGYFAQKFGSKRVTATQRALLRVSSLESLA